MDELIINKEHIPQREGYITNIFLCSGCEYKKYEGCSENYLRQGWCYTFGEIQKEGEK